MKKIILAVMSLSLLTGAVTFAQNDTATKATKKAKAHKKSKKSTATDTMSSPK